MTVFRPTTCLAVVALAFAAVTAAPVAAQAPAIAPAATAAPATSDVRPEAPTQAGPRLAPRWEPAQVLLPGQTQDREINAAARDTITIPVVTLLLGIIILILLVS